MTDQYRRYQPSISCPQSDSNRHWADFKNGNASFCYQQKQVAETQHIACKTPYLRVARTVAVRLRRGYKSLPVAYTEMLARAWRGARRRKR